MIRIFHGTSFENACQIQQEGFKTKNKTWDVSDDNVTYFHFNKKSKMEARTNAIENGKITAALNHSQSEDIYVYSLEISEDVLRDYGDTSYDGAWELAVALPHEILNQMNYQVEVVRNQYIPSLGLLYLLGLDKSLLNKERLTETEWDIMFNDKIKNYDDLLEIVYSY